MNDLRSASARRAAVGIALVAAVAISGCAQKRTPTTAPVVAPTASATPKPTGAPVDTRPAAPLTGAPVEAAVATRPAVAVVVAGSSPAGLDKADIVIEEVSYPTRWMAVFQSREADGVGPVVATRPADPMSLGVVRPAYAFRGGTTGMVSQVLKSPLIPVNSVSRPDLFTARGADLYASTARLRAATKAPAAKPMLVYGEPATAPLPGSKAARQAVVSLRGFGNQTWRYDDAARLWRRVAGGPAVAVANLIVQVVPYKTVQLGSKGGGYVPSARVFGDGVSTVLTGSAAVSGKWRKPGVPQQTVYTDASNVPVRLAPGPSWVILAPTGSTVTAS